MTDQLKPAPIEEFREIETAPKSDNVKVHEEAMNRWKNIVSREEQSRILAVGDLMFIDQEGGTYNEDTGFLSGSVLTNNVTDGDEPPPPRYQIDRISPVIEEAVSDQREAQVNIQVRATGETEKGLSETFNGLIKNIEVTSDAPDAYDNAFDESQKGGYGGWQIVTEYADDSFEQNIKIEPVLNATQSMFFGPSKKATKEDALYAFLIWDLDQEEFKVQYPKADKKEWPLEGLESHQTPWFNNRTKVLRLAAYWRKRPVNREIVMLVPTSEHPNGRVIDAEDFVADQMQIQTDSDGDEMRRKVRSYQVERFILNGVEVLKGPQNWAGKFIPLIPEFGIRSVINSREIIRGKVRKGKDAQRIYNYTTSAIVESGAQAGREFYWMTAKQVEGHIDELQNLNIDHPPIAQFTHDPDMPGAPVKAPGPTIQQALIEQRNSAREDINASVGAGVGVQDGTAADPRSGEAIREGNVSREKGNSIYLNNHFRAITYTGLQLADLISKLWTNQQQRRIIKPDGEEEFVTVNQTLVKTGENGEVEKIIVNDLSQAQFDVVVDVGPAYASQRQQGADQLTKLATENPAFATLTPDLIAKLLDIPGSTELFDRLRRQMVLQGTIEPTDDEREEFGLNEREQLTQELTPQIREQVLQETNTKLLEAQAAQLNAQAENFNAAVAVKEQEAGESAANIEKTLEETENTKLDSLVKAVEANTAMQKDIFAKLAAGIPLTQLEIDNVEKMDDIVEDVQQDVSPGPSSAMQEEFAQKTADADQSTGLGVDEAGQPINLA